MEESNLIEYIKSEKWIIKERTNTSLFLNSAKREKYSKSLKKFGQNFTENILLNFDGLKPIKAFNLNQTDIFYLHSKKIMADNPKIILRYIAKDFSLYKKIRYLCFKLEKDIAKKKTNTIIKKFNKILDLYELTCANFSIIFYLGLALAEEGDNNSLEIKQHNLWRNSIALEEESINKYIMMFIKHILSKRKLIVSEKDVLNYLTIEEFNNCKNNNDVIRLIEQRKSQGLIYLNLRRYRKMVEEKDLDSIKKYFYGLFNEEKDSQDQEIKGIVSYFNSENIIIGEVVLIKNEEELSLKNKLIEGKILVSSQVTPNFFPFLKGVKAIITDEGGITSHTAIISRELRIPCVIGTINSTLRLKDGDRVRINLETGGIGVI